MNAALVIEGLGRTMEGDATVLAASFCHGDRERTVWFRSADVPLAACADPFFAIGVVAAMGLGCPLEVRAPVSPRLLRAAPRIQEILHAWYPQKLRVVPVIAEAREGSTPPESGRGVAAYFTGGVDSSYTVLKHLPRSVQPVYVHGFDRPQPPEPLLGEILGRLREAAASFGASLLEVHTNVRDFADPIVDWNRHYHGGALAAAGLAMAPRFAEVLIAATRPYTRLTPIGSHAILDPLFSTEDVAVVHDGAERTRFQKTVWHVEDKRALAWLRVCWKNLDGAYNCGRCPKCLRTQLMLRAIDPHASCRTFAAPLRLTRRTWVADNNMGDLAEALRYVTAHGRDPALARVLRKCLAPPAAWRRALRRVRRLVPGRDRRS